MTAILLWLVSTFLDAFWLWFRKKSLNEWKLSTIMFKFFAHIFWFIMISWLIYFIWINKDLFNNSTDLLIIFSIILIATFNNLFQLKIMKKAKLSELLPYDNLDKLLIVIIWFFLFYWTDNETSIITLIITLIAIIVIILFTVDLKNIKIPKIIWQFFIFKSIKAVTVLWSWYFLLKYSAITYTVSNWILELTFMLIIAIITKDNFKTLLTQTKSFYTNRLIATFMWRSAFIIWLYIIQTSWVVIATLLWFFWIAFNIVSMKFILKDNPTKKQMLLAFIVILLIWTWYYFK